MTLANQRTIPARTLWLLALAALGLAVMTVGGVFAAIGSRRKPATAIPTPGYSDKDRPRVVGPLAPVLFGDESEEAVRVGRVLRSPVLGSLNLPYCCHLLRLYGLGPVPGPYFTSGREVLAALTDEATSQRYFGEPAFFPTRSGIRYRSLEFASAMGAENHRDICLASFAEAGLPLSTEFTSPHGTFHLRDLLSDSVQNFHLEQEELSWTAIAYALYPGLEARWTNRFGETFGWDELTAALLDAPVRKGSCVGTHLLYAMLVIRRVEGMGRPLITAAPVRDRLSQRLRAATATAVARQAADGHWSADWWAETEAERANARRWFDDSAATRLLITGHLMECLTLAPPELQPPAEVYRKAARWLSHMLDDGQLTGDKLYCPRTHAVSAVRGLCGANRN